MSKLVPLMPDEQWIWELELEETEGEPSDKRLPYLTAVRRTLQEYSMQDTEAYLSWLDAQHKAGVMGEHTVARAAEEARRYQRKRNVRETPDYVPRWLRWLVK